MKIEKEKVNNIKNNLISFLLKITEDKIKESKPQFTNLKQEASQAPGAMQSQHCGLKAEFSRLADSTQDKLNQLQKDFEFLQSYEIKNLDQQIVREGSLVAIEDPIKRIYFILPVCGGEVIKLKDIDEEITVMTSSTPLGSELLNKKINSLLNFRDKDISIIDIY